MEHTRAPPDLGRKGPGTAAAALLGGIPGRKGAASLSFPIGRGSGSPAGLVLDGRGIGSPAGLFPDSRGSGYVASVGRGSRPAASLFLTGSGKGTGSGFTRLFLFPASSSPASWESAGTSPTWDKDTHISTWWFHKEVHPQMWGHWTSSLLILSNLEQILFYRKQLAYELKHESNDHPSTSTQYIDESPLHVYSARPPSGSSRSPLHDLSSTKTPSVSGSSSSTSSDSLGGSKPNAGKEDTLSSSLGLNAEQEDAEVHNKPKRKRTKTDKTEVKTPVVRQRLHTETAHSLCDLVLKADPNNESSNLITLNSLVMTIKECATFLSGGSATLEMLKETLTLTAGLDIKENNRYRVIVGPMDMSTLDNDTGSEAFKDAVKTQMVVPSIPQTCMMVFLPVKKGSDWSVYCINKVCQRIDYLICSSNEEPMDAAELCKPLLKEVDFSTRKIFDFMDWSPAPVPFEKKISSSDTGLLAMYFMEMYNGKQFSLEVEDTKTWSESYRKSVLEQLFSQRANAPARKKKLLHPKA